MEIQVRRRSLQGFWHAAPYPRYLMISQSNLHRIAIRCGGKVMRKRYKVMVIFPCSNTTYSSMLLIGDDNSGDNDVAAVGLKEKDKVRAW